MCGGSQDVLDEVEVLGHDVDLREVLGLDIVVGFVVKVIDVRVDLEVVLDEGVDDTPELGRVVVRDGDRDEVLVGHGTLLREGSRPFYSLGGTLLLYYLSLIDLMKSLFIYLI